MNSQNFVLLVVTSLKKKSIALQVVQLVITCI